MERSWLLVGLEEGTTATVALIMLPLQMQSHQHDTLQRFVEMARDTAKTNGSGKLQIVCARRYMWTDQRATPTEEEEEEDIRQMLLLLPLGSCAIPYAESKRVKVITSCCDRKTPDPHYWEFGSHYWHSDNNQLRFFMANVIVAAEGPKSFENSKFFTEDEIGRRRNDDETDGRGYTGIQNFIKSICGGQYHSKFQSVAGQSKTAEFIEALKANRIYYLLIPNNNSNSNNNSKVMVDDLHGKTIGFIICDRTFVKCTKLQQIFKDLQKEDSNFMAIWIPRDYRGWRQYDGYCSYTRFIQCMPCATFPNPKAIWIDRSWCKFPSPRIKINEDARFVVLDKGGQIANQDALPLLWGWGVKFYPFTHHTIRESFFLMESESCLEVLLHGMNIVGRKPMKSKMTFLYASIPDPDPFYLASQLEELTQIHGSFEVLYVGEFKTFDFRVIDNDGERREYEEYARQHMAWPSLSFSDMIMFWWRCGYLASEQSYYDFNKEPTILLNKLRELAQQLVEIASSVELVLVDNDGVVPCHADEVVRMIVESSKSDGEVMGMVKDELRKSLDRGQCTPFVTTYFRDEIDDVPQHPGHLIRYSPWGQGTYVCDVCDSDFCPDGHQRSYRCYKCDWDICGSCWMAYAKQQAEQVQRAKHN